MFPGQKVEYQLLTTPQLPADMAYGVTEVAVTDTYSQYLEIDKQTLEITDLNTGKTIGKSKYATQWDDDNHAVRITFDADYVHDNWQPGSNPRILIRFEGTVSKDAPADIDGSATRSTQPSKDVTVSVGGDSVNGGSIYKDHMFLYQLDSSILPADRASDRHGLDRHGPAGHRA